MCVLYLIVYNFTKFRCAENCTPQNHFRCVMVCFCSCTPQKTRPVRALVLLLMCWENLELCLTVVRLMVNISSRQRQMSNLLQSLVLTSNQPFSNICLHSNQLGYHMFGLPWPRLKPPSPVSITWNCTTGICQAQIACCCTDTLVHWDSTQTDWPGSVLLDPVLILGWIPHGYLKYANF